MLPASLSSLCLRDSSGRDGKMNVISVSARLVLSRSDSNLLSTERENPTNTAETTINYFAI